MVLSNWMVGGSSILIPHVWGVERDLRWEGPEVYETSLSATAPGWLVFHGVSAMARVFVDGALVGEHLGIWDAFSIRVDKTGELRVRVEVTKNGGETIPVSSIASGFLPFVFGTFGGIYKDVEWIEQDEDPLIARPPATIRARFDGHRFLVDGAPVYLRGVLHWGWYPNLRHPAPDRETCKREIDAIKAMGFNCVKFCLWVPPHHYLEELEHSEMLAWMELPLWNPGANIEQFRGELERIVKQYRHHASIVLWTIGCELGHQMTREARRELFERVKEWTGGALVKDSSGGAEMYGGDPAEFGDFEDFHPYCDLENYPSVLDELSAGPRQSKGILLGECNDYDDHRDLPRIALEAPFWASDDPSLNDKGVRWQYDLPSVLANSRFAKDEEASRKLSAQSREMKLFIHRMFQEWLRSREFSGSVITGIADTPISTSGFFDDWGEAKFSADEVRSFMGPDLLFLVPQRRLPWMDGGNRVGKWDAWHVFEGSNRIRVGLHSESGFDGDIEWRIGEQHGVVNQRIDPLAPTEVLDITWIGESETSYELQISAGCASQSWPIECVKRREQTPFIASAGTVAAPAFREAAYEFLHPELERIFGGKPQTLYKALGGQFLAEDTFEASGHPLMVRVDTRTYRELPVVGIRDGDLVHSLRVGSDPASVLVLGALERIANE
ncbi:MAG: hypothetical protein ABIV13_02085 [Fimbriimonadales bacterium]